jgi:hypothetical protein
MGMHNKEHTRTVRRLNGNNNIELAPRKWMPEQIVSHQVTVTIYSTKQLQMIQPVTCDKLDSRIKSEKCYNPFNQL